MDLGNRLGHLAYSTLVHPGDTWEQAWDSLTRYVPAVRQRVAPGVPFGVSLRISSNSANRLTGDAKELAKLKSFMTENDMYLFTANAFPYGSFKNERVKELVYEPDWRTDDRAEYTMKVADILAAVAPENVVPSVQSPPCGFKPRVTGPDVVNAYTRQIVRVVAHLVELEKKTGRTVTLGLEPEPACFLEKTTEAIDYFQKRLFAGAAAKELAQLTGTNTDAAERNLRKHLGTVFDICHQAVEYEDIAASLLALRRAEVPVVKLQVAAAVRIPEVTQAAVDALKAFNDPVYLHQTFERMNGHIEQHIDLPDAFASWERDRQGREWRIHFHVPVFIEDFGTLKTTRPSIQDAFRIHRESPVSTQIEIETYTWDVLPEHYKTGDITDYVVREMEWVKGELTGR